MNLRFVNSCKPFDCFQFKDQLAFDQEVQSLATNMNTFIKDFDLLFAFKRDSLKTQFVVTNFFSSSFLRGSYLIGYFSTNRLAMTSRCSSFVPPPITSSGASR